MKENESLDIMKISKYIIDKYPDSRFTINNGDNIDVYSDDYLYDECLEFFTGEKLKLCGCGRPETTHKVIRDILHIIDKYKYKSGEAKDEIEKRFEDKHNALNTLCGTDLSKNDNWDGALQFIMHILDDKELLAHGSSIYGAWITEEGKMFLYLLEQEFKEEE